MIEKEIAELRRTLKAERNSATRVYGCYINGEGAIIAEFERSFGLISEEARSCTACRERRERLD